VYQDTIISVIKAGAASVFGKAEAANQGGVVF